MKLTPGIAIRKHCLACVGGAAEVHNCGGDHLLLGQGDKNRHCYFYAFRLGRGRPSVKLIRKFCLECQGGHRNFVAECENCDCPLHRYRFGTNPAYV